MAQEWNLGEKKRQLKKFTESAIIIAVQRDTQTDAQTRDYLNELEFLARTAGAETRKEFVQKRSQAHKSSYVGEGKLTEIAEYVEEYDIDMVLIDDDISPSQANVLEKELKKKIVDRSSLILDIFANRAQTAQAKTQVELAQLQYLLPRLRGMWTHLERQRGGVGMRGPGEKEIETDRRIVRDKISKLKTKLAKIDRQNETRRKNRGAVIRTSLVGYTNAGKSTLMNVLSKSNVFAEDKLFATLDTTTRKVVLGSMPFLLSDTVGFIRKLPHHLVESFKSTLDEVREADLLMHIVDISHPHFEEHIQTVNQTLRELGVHEKAMIMVFNKMDLYKKKEYDALLSVQEIKEMEEELCKSMNDRYGADVLIISAKNSEGIDDLKWLMQKRIEDLYMKRYPYIKNHW